MKKVQRSFVTAVLALGTVSLSGFASAVPIHQHYITNRAGTHAIANGFCINGLQTALDNFHFSVHTGVPSAHAFANTNNPVSISASGCP